MRKEVVLAIFLGLILGGIIVLGYYRSHPVNRQAPASNIQPTPGLATEINSDILVVSDPADGDIFALPVATVSGTTQNNARVFIITPNESLIVKPSNTGVFSQEIELDGGINQVQIVAIDDQGHRADRQLQLVYTTELQYEP